MSVAWSSVDSDLLLSCGKDNRIICWNPNSNQEGGEVLCELVDSNQWSFNVAWCPRNPALIAATSFDNRVSVYSLMGGQQQVNIKEIQNLNPVDFFSVIFSQFVRKSPPVQYEYFFERIHRGNLTKN